MKYSLHIRLIKYGQEKLHSRNHFDPQKGHYPVEIELIFLSN